MGFLRERRLTRQYGEPIIVISGLPRSGTSMMMKMVEAGGAQLVMDGQRTADEDNPKGYFELEKVKELDKTEDKAWLQEFRGKAVKIISFLLRDLPDDNYYKILFMRRNLEEIMASQNKMLDRRGEAHDESGDGAMMKRYTVHLKKVDFLLEEKENMLSLDIDYKSVVESPRKAAKRVRRFLGIPLDVDKMVAAVDKSLYRNRR
jgi:hypothetical protein